MKAKTLAYFASGGYHRTYQYLPFDKVYLIDNCFRYRYRTTDPRFKKNINQIGKVTCIGMDALESISYLKKESVKIDFFVSLNEGLWEGGGSYPINSDFFLGYAMPLLNDRYYHLMDIEYYRGRIVSNRNYSYNPQRSVSMDLPYTKTEINTRHPYYLNPALFSSYNSHSRAKIYFMQKIKNINEYKINEKLKISIVHDSIWNYYDELDILALSISNQGQGDFFKKITKVVDNTDISSFKEILYSSSKKMIHRVGFNPWLKDEYKQVYNFLIKFEPPFPMHIHFYHLNKEDYREFKELLNNH